MHLYNNNIAVVTGKMSYQFGEEKSNSGFIQIWSSNDAQWKRTTFQATLINKSK